MEMSRQGGAIVTIDQTTTVQRYEALDILRGVSLLGILLMNARAVLNPYDAPRGFIDPRTADLDRAAYWLLQVVADAKFYPIFSLLFGAGLALQWERRASLPRGFFTRRLLALFVFGALHGLLLWWGDILLPYAVLGAIVVIGFLKRPPMVNAMVGGLCVLGAVYVSLLLLSADTVAHSSGVLGASQATLTAGFGWDRVLHNASDYARALTGWGVIGFQVLGLMLLGVAWVQSGWLQRMVRGSFWSVKVDLAFWIAGGVFNALFVASDSMSGSGGWLGSRTVYTTGFILGGSLLGMAIALAVLRVVASGRAPWLTGLAPAGRTTLSSYLWGTVVFVVWAYALGLYGTVGNGATFLLAVGLFGCQVILTRYLTDGQQRGPVERLWWILAHGRQKGGDR